MLPPRTLPLYKQLAVVDLGQVQTNDIDISARDLPNNHLSPTINVKFTSANAAIAFLEAIAPHSDSDSTAVQLSLVLADENMQVAYQKWLGQHPN